MEVMMAVSSGVVGDEDGGQEVRANARATKLVVTPNR
jgi:hypothetical protein